MGDRLALLRETAVDVTSGGIHEEGAPDNDSESALQAIRAIAGRLAVKYVLAPKRVDACLRRLIIAEFQGRQVTVQEVNTSYSKGLLRLLPEALKRMPPQKALEFCESEDLNAYPRRVRIAKVLANEFIPLLTLDELADCLSELIEHQETNRGSLLTTGHPTTHFTRCAWLDLHFNKLYFTKLPMPLYDFSKPTQRSDFRPAISHFYKNRNQIAVRPLNIGPDDFDYEVRTMNLQAGEDRRCDWSWARWADEGWAPCGYDDADTLQRLSEDEIKRLDALRPKLFEVRQRVFAELAESIREQDGQGVQQRCIKIFSDRLTAEEVGFLRKMDAVYASDEVRTSELDTEPTPLLNGGLTSLLELIGHVKKELLIGTLAKTRDALSDALSLDAWQKPRFVTLVNRSEYRNLCKVDRRNIYLDLIAVGFGETSQAGLDIFADLDAKEPAFWLSYWDEVEHVLLEEPSTSIDARDTTKQDRVTSRFPSPADLKWEDVKIVFRSNVMLRVTVGDVSEKYMFGELGFRDGRKVDLPDTRWAILKLLAKHDGKLSWESVPDRKTANRVQAAIKDIRRRLELLMGIEEDPFHPYHSSRGWVTKFDLRDESFPQSEGSDDEQQGSAENSADHAQTISRNIPSPKCSQTTTK